MAIPEFHVVYEKILPVRFESLCLAVAAGGLCVLGLDETRQAAFLSLDTQGEVIHLREVPLVEVTGAAPSGDGLVVTGVAARDIAQVLRVSRTGEVEWMHELAVDGRLQHWPRPVEGTEGRWLLAITSRPSAVHMFGDRKSVV